MENPLADIDRILAISDPLERAREIGRVLNELPKTSGELKAARRAAISELRDQGLSLAAIGEKLDLHRNRVQHIIEGR